MADPIGNAAIFLDLAGTLVKMDETRQLPVDKAGNITIELMPLFAPPVVPQHGEATKRRPSGANRS